MRPALVALLGAVLLTPASAEAVEIQLRRHCRPQGAIVLVSDVAELFSPIAPQAAELARIELFPAPAPGRQRVVALREIQDAIAARGVNLVEHRFSGSSVVTVLGSPLPTRAPEPRSLTPGAVKQAQRDVSQAIESYLRQQAPGAEAWVVEVDLDSGAARAVSNAGGRIAVRGGRAPWTGNQRFQIAAESAAGPEDLTVNARVSMLGSVVVAVRPLPAGARIRPEDVQAQRAAPGEDAPGCFRAVGDVIGQETIRMVPEGKVLDRHCVRTPLAVRRGEVVTVYARSSGIRVRSTARSREDGALGDLVTVESFVDRKAFTARVCGIQEAEVFARACQAETPSAAPPARVAGEPAVRPRRVLK